MTKKIYFENLDGLRFLCFLSVFLGHSFHTDFDYIRSSGVYQFVKHDLFDNGNLGVNFFFVLSGFLITYLLTEEKKMNGQINVIKFWIRRVLRIWPLFYFCVIFGFFIFPILKSAFGEQPNERASIEYYLTFTNNFDFIKNGLPDASILAVLWSIAVEEQFYFLWPLLLYLLPVRKYWIAFSSVIIISIIFRAVHNTHIMHTYHTLSCIGDMGIGALGAWLIHSSELFKFKIQTLKPMYILLLYISFLFIFIFRDEILSNDLFLLSVMERPLIAVIIIFIILEQCYAEKSFFKMSAFTMATKLGTVSYGLYCFHFFGILTVTTLTKVFEFNTEIWQVLLFETVFALGVTILLSLLSYKVYERPFLVLKDKFAYIKTK